MTTGHILVVQTSRAIGCLSLRCDTKQICLHDGQLIYHQHYVTSKVVFFSTESAFNLAMKMSSLYIADTIVTTRPFPYFQKITISEEIAEGFRL